MERQKGHRSRYYFKLWCTALYNRWYYTKQEVGLHRMSNFSHHLKTKNSSNSFVPLLCVLSWFDYHSFLPQYASVSTQKKGNTMGGLPCHRDIYASKFKYVFFPFIILFSTVFLKVTFWNICLSVYTYYNVKASQQ